MGYRLRIIVVLVLCSLFHIAGKAEAWRTHFAYNNVTQIALGSDKVFAVSDGSLYSVEKQSERIEVYNRLSGLHETGITCIYYDKTGKQLLIAYGNGKIDILKSNGVTYLSELYNKDMTQRKTIYNVTLKGRTAYLSTHYGVQTLDLRENKLVDSYWLQPGGLETPVKDVKLTNDSIYAFTDDLVYCASLRDPLSDYHYWRSEPLGRITRDIDKGVHYKDGSDEWYAGKSEGIIRVSPAGRLTYKPQGPLVNTPYRMTATNGVLYVVPGGRWDVQYYRPGCLMRYDGHSWTNIPQSNIHTTTGRAATDFMNVAVDPADRYHCYVTAYGTGLYEFRNTTLLNHYIAGQGNNTLVSVSETNPAGYTRLDCGIYDQDGRLWLVNTGNKGPLQCLDEKGKWHAIQITVGGELFNIETSGSFLIDWRDSRHKWIACARAGTCILLLDDKGTYDPSDDRVIVRKEWTNQYGQSFRPEFIYAMVQDRMGRIWVGTEQGVAYIDAQTDFFLSDAIVQPDIQENGESVLSGQQFNAICQDQDGQIWLGSQSMGVYILNEAADEIVAHYTTDNTAMPANGILSLAHDVLTDHTFIGTADGLVEYDPNGTEGGISDESYRDDDEDLDKGHVMQWTLHPSYYDLQEVAAAKHAVFAKADGSLFCVDRDDEHIEYWNKSTGLSGSSVAHIAYDPHSGQLIIAYENGQIDLLSDDGKITSMPDISMKAGSMPVDINAICVGSRYSYLAMEFGILAINTKKAEISDTYYIGNEAASIAIQHIVEQGDSLYAFSFDRLYKAALKDNLVDYTYWKYDTIPTEEVRQAAVYQGHIYALFADSLLYRRDGVQWTQVLPDSLNWIHVSEGRFLTYREKGNQLSLLTNANKLQIIDTLHTVQDAIYCNNQYWFGGKGSGLVRFADGAFSSFLPEGPRSNDGYRLFSAHNDIYVAPGGRWATQFKRAGNLSVYVGYHWVHIPAWHTNSLTGSYMLDAVSYAVDSTKAGHFFVATYGTGVFEFDDFKAVQHYDSANSTLRATEPGARRDGYTRTEGAMLDKEGNLYVLNCTSIGYPLHVRTPYGQWKGLPLRNGGKSINFTTPTGIWTDRRNSQWKWMMDQRGESCLILLNDGGTPTISGDDRCIVRNTFVDQNGNILTPTNFLCFAQDRKNRIWIGTDQGLMIIPAEVDFFTSNTCQRIIIPRNDGTGLGDYLLGDEQINCLAVDGGNRMWIGTDNSGLYLIQDDTITVAHFTETNSLLPSNSIQSVAIIQQTGEVFVGTDKGIASYMSDASEPHENMNGNYAFPNPVRPDYDGYISIVGLMDNTEVNIIDSGGNLVCKTRSQGGTAVWDGKLPDGRRATAGVYTALCNAIGGHVAVKILVIR